MDMGSEFHLNQDILFEILSRATLKTLDAFKVVSKESKELVEESWFIKNYTEKTKNFIGYIVEKFEHYECSYTFVSINPSLGVPGIFMECVRGMKILASSKQGILCCRKYAARSHPYPYYYYVCKPGTRQCVELPTPRGRTILFRDWFGLTVLKSNPLEYKIIRLSRQSVNPSYICEIFDSKFWTWRRLKNIIMEHCSGFCFQSSVCIGGILYLLTDRNKVWAFDSATETHLEFSGPITTNKSYSVIVEYKGKLGFISAYKWEELHLWGLEDYRWEIKRVVRIDKKKKNRLIGCSLADMALTMGFSYQFSGFHSHQNIFSFRSDWEPVDLEDGCMLGGLEEMFTT